MLNELAKEIHKNAKKHGWWDGQRTFESAFLMAHTELSEAAEEYRNQRGMFYLGEDGKPEGVAVEAVDCIIRLLDYLAHEEVDIDKIMRAKMKYNETRPYRHGGKVI